MCVCVWFVGVFVWFVCDLLSIVVWFVLRAVVGFVCLFNVCGLVVTYRVRLYGVFLYGCVSVCVGLCLWVCVWLLCVAVVCAFLCNVCFVRDVLSDAVCVVVCDVCVCVFEL